VPVSFSSQPVFVCGLLAALTDVRAIAQANPEAAKVKNPVASTPESIEAGKATYRRYCASCHGINATGGSGSDIGAPPPDLTDAEWAHGSSDGEIFYVIKNGVPPDLMMEPWGDRIKDPDIWNVVNFVKSLAKK
jgi:mono/diheme cytochrome c family protein